MQNIHKDIIQNLSMPNPFCSFFGHQFPLKVTYILPRTRCYILPYFNAPLESNRKTTVFSIGLTLHVSTG